MGYKLYRLDQKSGTKSEVSFDDLDNKAFWCKLGSKKEEAFVSVMGKLKTEYKISIHPEKVNDPYHPDLLVEFEGNSYIGEAKIKNSPLFYAHRYDVDRQYALTMDLKDSFNYSRLLKKGIDLFIFIWVKWEAHEMVNSRGESFSLKPMGGVWVTRFSKLRKLETSDNPPGIHWYKERFRHPTTHRDEDWCAELLNLEPRLKLESGWVRNITSNGYTVSNGRRYPSGHSSGSYVFDLSDESVFENLYLWM